MSWIEAIKSNYEIETGDGLVYTPEWVNASVLDEYNLTVFNFDNVPGSLVKRKEPLGSKFSLEIYFQGENHLDVMKRFRASAKVKKPWRVRHPYYGEIVCHPASLRVDNSSYNISKITGIMLETITGLFPKNISSPVDEINNRKVDLDELAAITYESSVIDLQPIEIAPISTNLDTLEESTTGLIELQEDLNELKNEVNAARTAVVTILDDTAGTMRQIQKAINFPFRVISDVRSSINNLREQFNGVVTSLGNVLGLSKNEKSYLEIMGANMVSAATVASISQLDSNQFESTSEVNNVTELILDFYDTYIETLDSIQTETQTDIDSYAPNPDVIRGVQDIVFLTISKLSEIALESQVENIFITDEDTNLISLTHRFYGLDANDENIDKFIRTNKIQLSEILNIKKGREIIYLS